MLTASLKTVHVTLSLQEGVVREPLYRKYLVLLAGNRLSNLKAGMPPMDESTDTERDKNVPKMSLVTIWRNGHGFMKLRHENCEYAEKTSLTTLRKVSGIFQKRKCCVINASNLKNQSKKQFTLVKFSAQEWLQIEPRDRKVHRNVWVYLIYLLYKLQCVIGILATEICRTKTHVFWYPIKTRVVISIHILKQLI